MTPIFSIKYEDPQYPGYICAADWDGKERIWVRTIGLREAFEYTPPIIGLDNLALNSLLSRFGLSKKDVSILELGEVNSKTTYSFLLRPKTIGINTGEVIILRMSPAELIAKRREKEKEDNTLPRLEVATDNLDIIVGKGKGSHYAEEYE